VIYSDGVKMGPRFAIMLRQQAERCRRAQVMGLGFVRRSLAAALPLANEIHIVHEQHAGETNRSHAPPL